jgi:hypothetical protein
LAGVAHLQQDEGSPGNGGVFAGALTVPSARRWAVDLDVSHLRTSKDFRGTPTGGSHTHFAPALHFRSSGAREYGFAALDAGIIVSNLWLGSGAARASQTGSGPNVHGRAGFVVPVAGRWLFRADGFAAFRYAAPHAGVRAGFGYRC